MPIAAQPNGPPLAKLVPSRKAALNEVTVIDEDAGGMVADRAARRRRSAGGRLGEAEAARQAAGARHARSPAFGAGGIKRRARAARPATVPESYACAQEIPLVAEVGAHRRTVGSIGGGVHLRTTAVDAEFVAVSSPTAGRRR